MGYDAIEGFQVFDAGGDDAGVLVPRFGMINVTLGDAVGEDRLLATDLDGVGEHDPESRVEGGGLDVKESDTFWHGRVALRMIEQGMPMLASGLGHPNEFRFLEPPEIQLGQTDLLLWDGRNNDDGLGFGANDGAIGAAENPDDDVVP